MPRARARGKRCDRLKRAAGSWIAARACWARLSKGYQQRVGIAQAIIHDPDVVILDEPTVGLDPLQIREIRALIRELREGRSVILSTHILPEVESGVRPCRDHAPGPLRLQRYDRRRSIASRAGSHCTIAFRHPPRRSACLRACPA